MHTFVASDVGVMASLLLCHLFLVIECGSEYFRHGALHVVLFLAIRLEATVNLSSEFLVGFDAVHESDEAFESLVLGFELHVVHENAPYSILIKGSLLIFHFVGETEVW